MREEIIYPFPNINGAIADVPEWKTEIIRHINVHLGWLMLLAKYAVSDNFPWLGMKYSGVKLLAIVANYFHDTTKLTKLIRNNSYAGDLEKPRLTFRTELSIAFIVRCLCHMQAQWWPGLYVTATWRYNFAACCLVNASRTLLRTCPH